MAVIDEAVQMLLQHPLLSVSCSLTFYFVGLAIYRLYHHPLAQFPGPKLAALSYWYEFYFDGVLQGKYVFEVERMHQKYGSNACLDRKKQ